MPQLIPPPELVSLLQCFAPCFTRPAFRYFVDFVVAMIAATGRLTTTAAYRIGDGAKHWVNYSDFLSEYRWSTGELSQKLLDVVLSRVPFGRDDQGRRRLYVVVDETIVEKTSTRMFGVAWQHNTHGGWCRGTHILGHYWLMLGVRAEVGGRVLCLPLGFRLYRQKKRCPQNEYRTPCQLAIELLESLKWPHDSRLVRTVIADAGFADSEFLRWCVTHGFEVIVRGRMDARVHDLSVVQPCPLRGRPRKWGERIDLQAFAGEARHFQHTVRLCQKPTEAAIASVVGRHRASGLPIRFVIARRKGKQDLVTMSTDLSLTPREVVSLYADRFTIEMTFRDLKQHFGLGHYQVRKPEAIVRHVHLSAVACGLTQLLTLNPPEAGFCDGLVRWQPMPWRKPGTPISVHETQLLLRQGCELQWAFAHVQPMGRHGHKSAIARPMPHPDPEAPTAQPQMC